MDEATKIIIAGLIAASPGIYAVWRQLKRDKVDNATSISDAAVKLIAPLEDRIAKLERQIVDMEAERDALKDWAERLCCQVRDAGLVPERYIEPGKKDNRAK